MPRRFPCTVSLDVKEFADLGTTRPEVVSKIINSFHPIKPIVAVQFVGYDAKVTFESEAHKREVMANENCSLRGKCLECRQSGHFQRNCPVRLRRLQRSVDSLDPVPPGDVSGPPPSASPPGAGPIPVVLSGVPPIVPLANQPDGVASEESSSVDVRDNQLDEFASQSILADVSVVDPVSASAGPFGIKIGSSQPRAESQIPNLSMPDDTVTSDVSSDNDSLVSVSEVEITSSSNESNVSEHSSMNCSVISNTSTTNENISESNVMDNTSTTKENISESNVMESTCTVNENTSITKNSNVNDNVSISENVEIANGLTNSGSNLVSPGSSLNSVSFSGGAEAPLSSVGVSDSAVRVSYVSSGLRLSKGSSSGVSKPAAARPSGLRPGLRKVISDCSLVARRKH